MANELNNEAKVERKSIQSDGILTAEAREIAEPQFVAAQKASREMVKRIDESRRLTEKDMAFRCNTLD